MGLPIALPPGTPASDLEDLGERERSISAREAELLSLAAELESEVRLRRVKLDDALEALQALAETAVAPDAEAAFLRAMGIPVPPHLVSPLTLQALEQRRRALALRELALRAEHASLEARRQRLPGLDAEVDSLLAEAAALGRRAEGAPAAPVPAPREPSPAPKGPAPAEGEGASRPARGPEPTAAGAGPGPGAPAGPVANRRASPRVRVQAEVSMQSESNFFTGFSGDISQTGVFVATYHQILPPGTPVELNLALPGVPAMALSGVVRWVRGGGERSRGNPGMGIAFVNVGPRETAAIQHFLSGREPLFWSE